MCTNLYHQDAFLYLPEELPCASAATVISAISGSARCHRVHLSETLLLFIFHRELKLASYYSYQQLCQETNEDGTLRCMWCQLYSRGSKYSMCQFTATCSYNKNVWRKDMVHTLVFASTLFHITSLQASFQCHGACHIHIIWYVGACTLGTQHVRI